MIGHIVVNKMFNLNGERMQESTVIGSHNGAS